MQYWLAVLCPETQRLEVHCMHCFSHGFVAELVLAFSSSANRLSKTSADKARY